MNRHLFALLTLVSLALTGCGATPEHSETGFLSNYEQLQPSKEFNDANVYIASGFGGEELANVQSIHILPFEVWLKADDLLPLGSEQLKNIVSYFKASLGQALSPEYQIVDEARQDTLTIRGAFTSIEVTEPELLPTDFIPFRVVLNAGNAAYLEATDQQDLVTQVGIEVEFLLGQSSTPVFAMTSIKKLDTTVSEGKAGNTEAVKAVLDTWIRNFVSKLEKVRQPPV